MYGLLIIVCGLLMLAWRELCFFVRTHVYYDTNNNPDTNHNKYDTNYNQSDTMDNTVN
ncbi:MAG: hypothetical protein IJ759_06395 [Bacteroidales bacterium]|nr:hypothetical protein [Bacteroidales bacterium]